MKVKMVWDAWRKARRLTHLDYAISMHCDQAGYYEDAEKYAAQAMKHERQQLTFLHRILDAIEYVDEYDEWEWNDGGW